MGDDEVTLRRQKSMDLNDEVDRAHRVLSGMKFMTPIPMHLLCIFCSNLAIECWKNSCGHLLCGQCLSDIINTDGQVVNDKCPVHGMTITQTTVKKSDEADRQIRSLVVQCPNNLINGCEELFSLSRMPEHLARCSVEVAQCPLKCGQKIAKSQLSKHVKYGCPKIRRQDTGAGNRHSGQGLTSLPSIHESPEMKLGNETPILGPNSEDLILTSIRETRRQMELLRETILTVELRIDRVVRSVQEEIAELKESFRKLQTKMSVQSEQLQVAIDDHETRIADFAAKLASASTARESSVVSKLDSFLSAEESASLAMRSSLIHDGSFLWKVTDYSRLKRESREGVGRDLHSAAFYSDSYGYRMCLALDLVGDGSGKGTHLSVYLCLMKGPYDDTLCWPFAQKVTFILVDQRECQDKRHIVHTLMPNSAWPEYSRPIADKNLGRGFHRFVPSSVVESDAYLRNDTIYIKAIVDDTIVL